MGDDPVTRFEMTLASLEKAARVPAQEQTEEKAASEPHPSAWAWDEERRQARLAGGA